MMNILCSTDDNYVPHCGVMLQSLFENNASHTIDVWVLTGGVSNESVSVLSSLCVNKKHNIHIIKIDELILDKCPIRLGDHVSIVTYYRILAPLVLPRKLNKILYLDCDMIITGDIFDLYNYDVECSAIGASLDEDYLNAQDRYERLQYKRSLLYVNAGVLLINLKYWREYKIMEECLEYIETYPERCLFHDQDVLNYVLRERKKLLPIKYNFQTGFLYKKNKVQNAILAEIHKIVDEKSYVVIHYTGKGKPWSAGGALHPYKCEYLKYKNLSPFAKIPIPKPPLAWRLKRMIHNIFSTLGLVKSANSYIVKNGKRC